MAALYFLSAPIAPNFVHKDLIHVNTAFSPLYQNIRSEINRSIAESHFSVCRPIRS